MTNRGSPTTATLFVVHVTNVWNEVGVAICVVATTDLSEHLSFCDERCFFCFFFQTCAKVDSSPLDIVFKILKCFTSFTLLRPSKVVEQYIYHQRELLNRITGKEQIKNLIRVNQKHFYADGSIPLYAGMW